MNLESFVNCRVIEVVFPKNGSKMHKKEYANKGGVWDSKKCRNWVMLGKSYLLNRKSSRVAPPGVSKVIVFSFI